ncbi:hypothetical protein AAC387_Pa06g0818 [Persea americana]|eukprot:TRINITY_DN22523_c0_g1_i1.p1 TRINITY_DN22523_c0_g1~~TRINITY_DN22523_c0_g1_i1.p1  ORF type:complete len:493 (+),score=127.77 TRINITY_DN22523_c0_g1_i1:114-1481(+)
MASKKKASEGIALLSMYNDEDMDVDDEDEEEQEEEEEEEIEGDRNRGSDPMNEDAFPSEPFYGTTPPIIQSQTPISDNDQTLKSPPPLTPQPQIPVSSPPPLPPVSDSSDVQRMRKGAFGIVDYAHDETAMSPDAEEGEIVSTGSVMLGRDLQDANGNFQEKTPPGTVQILTPNIQATPPQSAEQLEQSNYEIIATKENAVSGSKEVQNDDVATVSTEMANENVDPLEKFLPTPPKTKCPEELQKKINKFLELKKKGISFNADLRNRKDYRNPDFLLHAVSYQDIDQIGTCFSKDVFDPHGYDKSDYYDEIEADMKREMERKEQERKKSPKVDFVPGSTQPGTVASAPKISTQIAASVGGFPAVAATGAHTVQPAVDAAVRDSRQNKKTKWDKVDGDRRNTLHPGGQDTISTTGAHAAALLSAANAGAGYTAFAQQKRREAEEKRSSERRLEKRS